MKTVIQLFLVFTSLLTILGCGINETKFNKSKWREKVDWFYPYREKMVADLISNHLHKGMSYEELIDLLGEPENNSDLEKNSIVYGIVEDYGWDIDPVETKTLRISLTKDSLVDDYKIIYWKN